MILVSFFSSDEAKPYKTFGLQNTGNLLFHLFWDIQYMCLFIYLSMNRSVCLSIYFIYVFM